jgi:hypothetical protein
MRPDEVIASFERAPIYINKLLNKLAQLQAVKEKHPHSSDIESEIEFIQLKLHIIRDNFDLILGFLEFNMALLETHFKEIDDLFE